METVADKLLEPAMNRYKLHRTNFTFLSRAVHVHLSLKNVRRIVGKKYKSNGAEKKRSALKLEARKCKQLNCFLTCIGFHRMYAAKTLLRRERARQRQRAVVPQWLSRGFFTRVQNSASKKERKNV
jgi:hypothetical protein